MGFERMWKQEELTYLVVLAKNLPGETEKKQENLLSE
jgi:hypothetical protein